MAEQKKTADGRPIIWSPQPGPQTALLTCPVPDVFYGGARGGGKLTALWSKICTPKGWVPIGSLRVGDTVTDPTTGGACDVIGVFPQGEQDIYKITCDDGAVTYAGLEHLWAYKRPNHVRPRTKPSSQREFAVAELGATVPDERWNTLRVGRTADLIELLANGERPRIPLTEPVIFTRNAHNEWGGVDPYLLGILLGDGHIGPMTITSCDDEIRDYLVAQGFRGGTEMHTDGKPKDWRPGKEIKERLVAWVNNNGLRGCRAWEKFIPDHVLVSSLEYRLEFLRGLMDTDGYADKDGAAYFCTTSPRLRDGVTELVRSLGGKTFCRTRHPTYTYLGEKKSGREAYDMQIQLRRKSALFRLTRKKERCRDSWNGGYELMRAIVGIEKFSREEAICIKVSSPYGLYLADDYVVTHNTDGMIADWIGHMTRNGGHSKGIFMRRTYPELAEVWSRMMELYPATGGESNKSEMLWQWPNGARIELRYLENDDDAARYMGRSFTAMYIDEITNFTSISPIDKLYATLRSPHGIPCVRRSSGNPGGPLTSVIKARYIDPSKPFVPFHWAPNLNRPDLTIESVFIPSTLDNNKILTENDPGYEARLAGIGDPELYKAWRYGDWNVLSGRYFGSFSRDKNVIEPKPLQHYWPRWIGVDWGYSHDASVHWGCYDGTTVYVYREYTVNEATPVELARRIFELTSKHERIERVFLSPDAFARKSSPRTIADEIRSELPWPVVPADNDRIGGWSLMQTMLRFGTLKIFDNCARLTKWLGLAQRDPKRPEDVLKTEGDDVGDSCRYLIKSTQIEPHIPADIVMEQKIKPFLDKEDYMGAFIQRMRMKDELEKNKKPLKLKGRRR